MIEALAPVFSGPLAHAGHWLVLPETPETRARRPIPCADLLRAEVLLPLLDTYAAQYHGADRRAAVSMWTQYYCAQLIYSTMGAHLRLGRALPVRLEDIALLVTETGTPDGFRIPHAGAPLADIEGMEAFATLFRAHLQPLFTTTIAARAGVAARLLWTNAGVRVVAALRLAEQRPEVPRARIADGRALIANRHWADGEANPLFQAVKPLAVEGKEVQRRRVCCLRYMLPGVAGCGATCPLPAGQCGRQH